MSNAPTDIRLHRRSHLLEVSWADGSRFELPCELLRVYSPSAEVRGHGAGDRILQTGKKHVNITGVEPVGNYAVKLSFDDGHDTGLYSWDFLRDLGENREQYWSDYLRELEQANASRLPAITTGEWRPGG
ncbi:MAG: DUF971 domain-containing protein [Gammaproteobacteria bacterium]|nr:DUF971 domain-containing protein [Gammaproteobacteria bacterium]